MAAANRVPVLSKVGGEGLGIALFDECHALSVQPLDVLVDVLAVRAVEGLVLKAAAPVAKVGADNEEVRGVGEVLGENPAVNEGKKGCISCAFVGVRWVHKIFPRRPNPCDHGTSHG